MTERATFDGVSSIVHEPTMPLPPRTLEALRAVVDARGVSTRKLASSIGTVNTHVGRILNATTRPSVVLAVRIGEALDLPDEFTAAMVAQSSHRGRKVRHGDDHAGTAQVGSPMCPVDACRVHRLMADAIAHEPSTVHTVHEFSRRLSVYAVGVFPAMGGPMIVGGAALDPWHDFGASGTTPLAVYRATEDAPRWSDGANLAEFISGIPPDAMIRCTHHDRRPRR